MDLTKEFVQQKLVSEYSKRPLLQHGLQSDLVYRNETKLGTREQAIADRSSPYYDSLRHQGHHEEFTQGFPWTFEWDQLKHVECQNCCGIHIERQGQMW